MAICDNSSGAGGFGLGGSGDDPNRNRKNQPDAFPPDPNGLEPTSTTKTTAGRRNRNSLLGGQAGEDIQAGSVQELARALQDFVQLRRDFVQLQQDLAQERHAREQLEGRVNDIQQQLQQGVPKEGQDSIRASSTSDDSEDEFDLEIQQAEIQQAIEELLRMDEAAQADQAATRERQTQVARTFCFAIGWVLLAWYASGLMN